MRKQLVDRDAADRYVSGKMNIREALIAKHSKQQTVKIVNYIGKDPERFSDLMSIFFGDHFRLAQRAAWVVSHVAESSPGLVQPYLSKMVTCLTSKKVHDALKRCVLRSLQYLEIPEKLEGKIYSISLDLVDEPREPAAIRVFAMSAAAKIANGQPDLMNEISLIVNKHIEHSSAAFRARARMIFAKNKFLILENKRSEGGFSR